MSEPESFPSEPAIDAAIRALEHWDYVKGAKADQDRNWQVAELKRWRPALLIVPELVDRCELALAALEALNAGLVLNVPARTALHNLRGTVRRAKGEGDG